MATELDKTSTLQALADSSAFIIDRAQYPEKVVGQAWLISKGRVVTTASSVSNYAEAPWALQIKFPHPGISYAVRTVTLHPDFNKREARDYYLAQAHNQLPPLSMANDIATLALDSDLTPPAPERIAELNRALSVPFEISGQDMSGAMRQGDLPSILKSIISTGRSGLMTMIDSRNLPIGRIQVRQTRLVRASFQGLYNELAICELLYKQPPGSFAFQPAEFRWPPDVPEMATPIDQVMAESQRRNDEVPRLIEMLGGSEARFQKAVPLADFSTIKPQDRWLAERVWECLDGYLPLCKLSERIGCDTYSALKMVWDLATMGLLSVSQNVLFHGSGQLGPLLVPAQELDLNTWDVVQAFYLDPVSGCPVMLQGNMFGPCSVLSNRTLLHTIPIPPNAPGAIVLREGKLVGLHTGPYSLAGVNNPPPLPLQRMMWIGTLNDLGTKRLRTAEVAAAEAAANAEAEANDPVVSQRTSMKMLRPVAEPGTVEASGPLPEVETGPLAKFSKMQIAGASGVVFLIGVSMMLMSMFSGHGGSSAPPPTQPPADQKPVSADHPPTPEQTAAPTAADSEIGDPIAAAQAKTLLGWTKPPDSFKFVDTTKLTEPKPSFGIASEAKNLQITFVEWPNIVPLQDVEWIAKHTPVYNLYRYEANHNEFSGTLSKVIWAGSHYNAPDEGNANYTVVVGAFPEETSESKCMVFVAKAMTEKTNLSDIQYPAGLVDHLLSAKGQSAVAKADQSPKSAAVADSGTLATGEQLSEYRKKLQSLIHAEYHPPKYDLETNTKLGITLTIGKDGSITEMELDPNPSDGFNEALTHAVKVNAPFPVPPRTKQGTYTIEVRAHANDITVNEK